MNTRRLRQSMWMSSVLWGAALCNTVLGAWMMFFPRSAFSLAHVPPPRCLELWQSLGILAFVLGVGYAIAAVNPLRHWPIVATGLVGQFLAPFAFGHFASVGQLPWAVGWTVLVSDVIWCVPFGFILKAAWECHLGALRYYSPEVLPCALRTKVLSGASLDRLSRRSPVLLVFLRHAGCVFCREALADLARQRRQLEDAGMTIVLVHMGDEEFGREFFSRYGLGSLPRISDPRRALYRAFGLRRGNLRMLFGPKVWLRGFRAAFLEGHGFGPWIDDGLQMPGIFLIFHGQVVRSFRHQSAADRPNYVRFSTAEIPETA